LESIDSSLNDAFEPLVQIPSQGQRHANQSSLFTDRLGRSAVFSFGSIFIRGGKQFHLGSFFRRTSRCQANQGQGGTKKSQTSSQS
jgi:hypothetical protein